jgi:hypothetical protein
MDNNERIYLFHRNSRNNPENYSQDFENNSKMCLINTNLDNSHNNLAH